MGCYHSKRSPMATKTISGSTSEANVDDINVADDLTVTDEIRSRKTSNQIITSYGTGNATTLNNAEISGGGTISTPGVAGTLVEKDAVQTLTNKSLTAPTLTGTTSASVLTASSTLSTTDTTDATSSSTGSLRSAGGCGIAKKLYVGTGVYVPSSGGTASEWNHYEKTTHSTNWTGAIADEARSITCIRNGDEVTIAWAELLKVGDGGGGIITTSSALPARFRPAHDYFESVWVQNNGTWTHGHVRILTSGFIEFYAGVPSTSFSAAAGNMYIPGLSRQYPNTA